MNCRMICLFALFVILTIPFCTQWIELEEYTHMPFSDTSFTIETQDSPTTQTTAFQSKLTLISQIPDVISTTTLTLSFQSEYFQQYSYSLNDGTWSTPVAIGESITLAGMTDGTQTLRVRGIDSDGNPQPESEALVLSWKVDTTLLIGQLVNPPQVITNQTQYELHVVSEGVVSYKYLLDASGTGDFSQEDELDIATPIAISFVKDGTDDGQHVLQLIVQDKQGNWQTEPTEYYWNVDTEAPVASNPLLNVSSRPGDSTINLSWAEAYDNYSSQDKLTYCVYYSTATMLSSLDLIQDSGTRLECVQGTSTVSYTEMDPQLDYHFNITVTDEAGNLLAYSGHSTYSPYQVDTLLLWLRSTVGIEKDNANAITAWNDQSPSAFSATPTEVTKMPLYVADGLGTYPVVRFNTAADSIGTRLDLGSAQIFSESESTNGLTIMVVSRTATISDATNNHFVFDYGSFSEQGYGMHYLGTEVYIYTPTNYGGVYQGATLSLDVNEFNIFTIRLQNETSMKLFMDGKEFAHEAITVPVFNQTTMMVAGNPSMVAGPFTIGGKSSNDAYSDTFFQGDIVEFIVFKQPLSIDIQDRMEQYLSEKYNISIQ